MKTIIGISGGIGSGKSAIAQIFGHFGGEILNADQIAHQELEEKSVKERLQSRFGHGIVNSNGSIDRSRLAEIVFNDIEARTFLEACIHPGVRSKIEARIATSKAPFIILDVPLLETSPLRDHCTHRVFVKVSDTVRWSRVSSRGWTHESWKKRENAQVPLSEKEHEADWVLENSEPLEKAQTRIKTWLQEQGIPIKETHG